jgi:site-specific recombinase XerD
MTIKVECAKGKKDRYVPYSPALQEVLREYYLQYKRLNTYLKEHRGEVLCQKCLGNISQREIENEGNKAGRAAYAASQFCYPPTGIGYRHKLYSGIA